MVVAQSFDVPIRYDSCRKISYAPLVTITLTLKTKLNLCCMIWMDICTQLLVFQKHQGPKREPKRALFTTKIRLCADIHSATENESLFLRRILWNDFKRLFWLPQEQQNIKLLHKTNSKNKVGKAGPIIKHSKHQWPGHQNWIRSFITTLWKAVKKLSIHDQHSFC